MSARWSLMAAGDKLAQGCWTGKVRSNEISFNIK